jgi:NAD(P)-dependent dehydrogenase (short-subunit alcohol dehydrogenase family)
MASIPADFLRQAMRDIQKQPRRFAGGRKLAQIMFTFDLAREFNPATITANCLHPATYMATTMVRQSGNTPISTVEEGAEAILNLAASEELDGNSGEFYNGLRPSRANRQAHDDHARERLRMLSMRLTGLALPQPKNRH